MVALEGEVMMEEEEEAFECFCRPAGCNEGSNAGTNAHGSYTHEMLTSHSHVPMASVKRLLMGM